MTDSPCPCTPAASAAPGRPSRLGHWEKIVITALIGLSGLDTHAKSEIAAKLDGIQSAIVEISKSVAVAVQRIEDHDRRIQNLEALNLRVDK